MCLGCLGWPVLYLAWAEKLLSLIVNFLPICTQLLQQCGHWYTSSLYCRFGFIIVKTKISENQLFIQFFFWSGFYRGECSTTDHWHGRKFWCGRCSCHLYGPCSDGQWGGNHYHFYKPMVMNLIEYCQHSFENKFPYFWERTYFATNIPWKINRH